MKSKPKLQQPNLFEVEAIVQSKPKPMVGSTKKIVIDTSFKITGETGLNSVWRNFGEWISTGRNNKID